MASKLGYDHPDLGIAFFYMDIQNVCRDFERFIGEAASRMRFIRGLPGDFYTSEKDRVSIGYYDPGGRKSLEEDFDMVVLSVGLTPGPSHGFFSDRLDLSVDEDGFLRVPEGAENQGVVLAGTVEGPMDVSESISHAKRAVFQVGRYLGLC
jgi:heterodisulfide reductase subunit A